MAKVLVIDDSRAMIAAVSNALKQDGHFVEALDSFANLVAQLRPWNAPDVIILDLNMPMLDGVKFAHFIRKAQPRPIPIILHSSEPQEALDRAAGTIGVAEVVRKQGGAEAIRAAVKRVVAPGRAGAHARQ